METKKLFHSIKPVSEMSDENIKTFKISNKYISIKLPDDYNIDIDDILKIDYANIMGELLTFPVIVNRLGVLLSDIEDYLRKAEFQLEVDKDELRKQRGIAEMNAFQALKTGKYPDGKTYSPINSPTKDQVQNLVRINEDHQLLEEEFRKKEFSILDIKKDKDQINSFYWSAKSKLDILTKMTDKLSPVEFENKILEGSINNISIKVNKSIFD